MIIDVWAQATTPRFAAAPWLQTLLKWTGREGDTRGTTVAETLAAMDAAGVDITFLSAWSSPTGDLISTPRFVRFAPANPWISRAEL